MRRRGEGTRCNSHRNTRAVHVLSARVLWRHTFIPRLLLQLACPWYCGAFAAACMGWFTPPYAVWVFITLVLRLRGAVEPDDHRYLCSWHTAGTPLKLRGSADVCMRILSKWSPPAFHLGSDRLFRFNAYGLLEVEYEVCLPRRGVGGVCLQTACEAVWDPPCTEALLALLNGRIRSWPSPWVGRLGHALNGSQRRNLPTP